MEAARYASYLYELLIINIAAFINFLLAVLHVCEIWSLTLGKERRFRVWGNRMLRRKFSSKRGEITGCWRGLHNEELRNSYASPNIISVIKSRRMRWAGHVARMGETRKAYKSLVRKHERERPLGRSRHR
jgi:hypothetical protein